MILFFSNLLQAAQAASPPGSPLGFWIFLFIFLVVLICIIVCIYVVGIRKDKAKYQAYQKDLFYKQMRDIVPPKTSSRSVNERLYELKKMLDDGVLTQEEFDKVKDEILDEI